MISPPTEAAMIEYAYTAGGTMLPSPDALRADVNLSARFWSKVKRQSVAACWPWLASREEKGYGQFFLAGRKLAAHRVAYMLANGRWPHPDKMILHTCDNPSCVNPRHLIEGTCAENNRDTVEKARHQNGATKERASPLERGTECWRDGPPDKMRVGCSRFSAYDVQEIRREHAAAPGRDTLTAIADRHNVRRQIIKDIVNRRTFHWVRDDFNTNDPGDF